MIMKILIFIIMIILNSYGLFLILVMHKASLWHPKEIIKTSGATWRPAQTTRLLLYIWVYCYDYKGLPTPPPSTPCKTPSCASDLLYLIVRIRTISNYLSNYSHYSPLWQNPELENSHKNFYTKNPIKKCQIRCWGILLEFQLLSFIVGGSL